MTMAYIDAGLKIVILILGVFSMVYAAGVVWRVEKELDISYKLFLTAIVFFLLGQILELFFFDGRILIGLLVTGSRFIFSAFFLGGIWTMRDLVRILDGEKPERE